MLWHHPFFDFPWGLLMLRASGSIAIFRSRFSPGTHRAGGCGTVMPMGRLTPK
jgi:hypothetical protein